MNRPFNEAKYKALLEGLEATEIKLSEIIFGTTTKRFDPEYFNRTAILAQSRLSSAKKLGDLVKHGYRVVYEETQSINREDGIKSNLPFFLQSADISTPFINLESMNCVKYSDWVRYPKGRIERGEILIEVKGKAEKIALVPDDFPENTLVTGTCFKLTTKNPKHRFLLMAYLTCKYGMALKDRLKTNLLVSYVAKDDLYSLPIPKLSDTILSSLEKIFNQIFTLKKQAHNLASQAENLLLQQLELENWQPRQALSNTRKASDVFATQRMDAEYYQAKFDELEAKIAETHTLGLLSDFVTINQRGTQPNYADDGLPVINSKHVREGEVLLSADNRFALLPDKDDALTIKKGDVLINGTGVGTIGRSAPYLHEQKAIPDNHVTILRTDKIDPIFLSVYLNSIAGKYQVEKYFKGSSGQIELYPTDIGNFYVPIVESSIQIQIADFVRKSFTLKAKSEQLLEAAKRAVEIAIENSEEAAMHYLEPFLQDDK